MCKRPGTLSLLASVDPVTGEATPPARETRKAPDYVDFPKIFGAKYPEGDLVRVVPDDASVHGSAETGACLAAVPVPFRWKRDLSDIDPETEELAAETLV